MDRNNEDRIKSDLGDLGDIVHMMSYRRVGLVLLLVLTIIITVSGCGSITESASQLMENYFIEHSGIKTDDEYIHYNELAQSGQLDETGMFNSAGDLIDEDYDDSSRPAQIYVTLGENAFLDVAYYSDPGLQNRVYESCYLNPNDCLYYTVDVSNSVKSNLYGFEGFKIYEYSDGADATELSWQSSDSNCVFQVPMTYEGTELSVIPVGRYEKRELTLNDYLINDSGNSSLLAGTWMIDDVETQDNTVKINPITNYVVSYSYDSNEYFFVKSTPECRYLDPEEGYVIFEEGDGKSSISEYNIELHRLISVNIKGNVAWQYRINNGDLSSDDKKEKTIQGLRYNDKIIVSSEKEIDWDYEESRLSLAEESIEGEYKYTFTVKEINASFYFDPDEYTYPHGTVRFKCRGQLLTEGTYIGEGSQIDYEAETVDEGYWLPLGNHSIVVTTEQETRQALRDIKFYEKKEVNVTFPQPQCGGTISYYVGVNRIDKESARIDAGTVVRMEFNPWNGWQIKGEERSCEYIVKEKENQICDKDGNSVDTVFIEDKDHKPNLTVLLDKSVGETLKVSVAASGQKKDIQYQSQIIGEYKTSFNNIGTEKGVSLSLSGDSLKTDEAIKITVRMKPDNSRDFSEETRYVDSIPNTVLFDIYSLSDIATSDIYYESVEVLVSRVQIQRFQSVTVDNGKISVKYSDTNEVINDDEYVDNDRKVTVSIEPDKGYYVSGNKDVSNDAYTKTMTFKKYSSDIEKIIKDHPILKIYTVILDNSDNYGTVHFYLNGTEVSGAISVRDKQTLKMKYAITDSNYEIERNGWNAFLQSKTSKTVSIPITKDLDGTSISRTSYISVIKK